MSLPTIYRGLTWRRTLTVVNAATGLPYDITGAAISFAGKHRTADTTRLVDLAVGSGITISVQSGDTLGQAEVEIDGTISSAFPPDIDSIICACVATVTGDTEPKVVLKPFRVDVRELP